MKKKRQKISFNITKINKQFLIGIVAVIALLALFLLLFFSDQFVGKAGEEICNPNWILEEEWSECQQSLQYKNYYDNNRCNLPEDQPTPISQSCNDNLAPIIKVVNPLNNSIINTNSVLFTLETDEPAFCYEKDFYGYPTNDFTPPVVSNPSPTGNISSTGLIELSFQTDEWATCKGSLNEDVSYEDMEFDFSGYKTFHQNQITLSESGEYTIFVKCVDFAGNMMPESYKWSFNFEQIFGGGSGSGGGSWGPNPSGYTLTHEWEYTNLNDKYTYLVWATCEDEFRNRDTKLTKFSVELPEEIFDRNVWASIKPEEKIIFKIENDKISITEINFEVIETAYGAWLKVIKKDNFPISVKNFSDKIYQRLEIVKCNSLYFKDEVIKNIKINFKVEKQWLTDNGFANNQISLFRYANEEWAKLPTGLSNDDETYVYYSADAPGFSYFIIGGNKDIIPPIITVTFPQNNSTVTNASLINAVRTGIKSWKFEKSYKKLEMANNDKSPSLIEGETISSFSSFIGEEELDNLADGVWTIGEQEYKYQQFLFFDSKDKGNEIVKYAESDESKNLADHFFIKNEGQIARYQLEFASPATSKITDSDGHPITWGGYLHDFQGTVLNIFDKEYNVISAVRPATGLTTSIKLILMAGTEIGNLLVGEAKEYYLGSKKYDVRILSIPGDRAQLEINGETFEQKFNDVYTLNDGTKVGIDWVWLGEPAVTLYLDADRMELKDTNVTDTRSTYDLVVDNEIIEGAHVIITGTDNSSIFAISTIQVNMTAVDDYWVPAGGKLSDAIAAAGEEKEVLMGSLLDIEYHGLTEEITHNIELIIPPYDRYELMWSDGDNNRVIMPVASAEAAYNLSLGVHSWISEKDIWKLILKELTPIKKNDYFVVTGGNPSKGSAKSYLLQYLGADNLSKPLPKIRFKNIGSRETLEYSVMNDNPKATIQLGGFSFIVENASNADNDDFQILVDLDTTYKDTIYKEKVAKPIKDTMLEGDSQDYYLGNQKYSVSLTYVDATKAKFNINGEATTKLAVGEVYTLNDGNMLAVSEVLYQSVPGGAHSASFNLTENPIIEGYNHLGIGEEQVAVIDSYGSQWSFDWDVDTAASSEDQDYITITQTTPNENDYDNLRPSDITLNITAVSGPEVRAALSGVKLLTPDDKVGVSYGYTSRGAFMKFKEQANAPAGFTLTYPEKQRLPQVYITGKTETLQLALIVKASTDENAICFYKVGSDEQRRMDETGGTVHIQSLFDLVYNQNYHVSMQCKDGGGNLNQESVQFYFGEPVEVEEDEQIIQEVVEEEEVVEELPPAEPPLVPSTSGGGSGSSDSEIRATTFILSETQLSVGNVRELKKNDQVKFKLLEEDHVLKVNSVSSSQITITVSSEPQQKTISLGSEATFELGEYDLLVKYLAYDKETSEGKLFIKEIKPSIAIEKEAAEEPELAPPEEVTVKPVGYEQVKKPFLWSVIAIIVIVVGVGIVILLLKKKKVKTTVKKKTKKKPAKKK